MKTQLTCKKIPKQDTKKEENNTIMIMKEKRNI